MKTKPKPNELDTVIGKNLRSLRKAKGITQTELANALDISFQQIQKYELGKNRISASRLFEAAQILECDLLSFYKELEETNGQNKNEEIPIEELSLEITTVLNSISDHEMKLRLLSFLKFLSRKL